MKPHSIAIKVTTLLAIIGALMIVLFRIEGLNDERQRRAREAQASVEQAQAGRQALLGPVLRTSCAETWQVPSATTPVDHRRDFISETTPDRLDVTTTVRMEPRKRGLFKINTYVASTTLTAHWTPTAPSRQEARSTLTCGPSQLMVAVTDSRGLRSVTLKAAGQGVPVLPGTLHDKYPSGFHADLPEGTAAKPFEATVSLDLVGTSDLAFTPVGDNNTIKLDADWAHPSFGGRFLPLSHQQDKNRFSAQWAISSLATGAAQEYFKGVGLCAGVGTTDSSGPYAVTSDSGPRGCIDTFGVAFIDPVNPYSLSDRALKYGLLFVALSFVAVGMVEVMRRLRVHPVQYLLVGSALSLFFLLLLSLSEHLPFTIAYLGASTACVLLLTYYGVHVLGGLGLGLAFGAGIATLYGAMFALLQMEQTALVIGSLLLFAVLAAVMVLTRRIDWYGLVGTADKRGD